jgi:hypothetical protein
MLVSSEFEAGWVGLDPLEKRIERRFLDHPARILVTIPTELPRLRAVAVVGLMNEPHRRFVSDVAMSRAALEV